MEAQLEHDLQQKRESDLIAVTVRLNDNDDSARELSVRPAQAIHESIAEAFGCKVWQLEEIDFGGQAVEQGVTYEDYGVEVPRVCFLCFGWRRFACGPKKLLLRLCC